MDEQNRRPQDGTRAYQEQTREFDPLKDDRTMIYDAPLTDSARGQSSRTRTPMRNVEEQTQARRAVRNQSGPARTHHYVPDIRSEEGSRSTVSAPSAPAASTARQAMFAGQSPDTSADVRAEVMAMALEKYRARKKAKELEQTGLSRLKSASRTHAQPQEQPSEKRKLDIDPRKLVIYSEIMKPKF